MVRAVRDRLAVGWIQTQRHHTLRDPKRVYYLSLEYLIGRSLDNALQNIDIHAPAAAALDSLGFRLEDVLAQERDPGLGNGGLGRLAACYLDSLATLDYPAWGYGLRYRYGIFRQLIVDGRQVEAPDYWLDSDAWDWLRAGVRVPVRFYGSAAPPGPDRRGAWSAGDVVDAVAHDIPVPGYATRTINNLRLWEAVAADGREFDFAQFNAGNYPAAAAAQQRAHRIDAVLYPNDGFDAGKELRLTQQYFWCAASLHDILRRFRAAGHPWSALPDHVAIQLNDTHPALAVVELQRILVDLEGLDWSTAWDLVCRSFAYTNHTVLPEALEKWPLPLFGRLLPRHLQIVFDLNLDFLTDVAAHHPGDVGLLSRVSLIEESAPKQVRMAHIAVIGSHSVNGVAALHSDLVCRTIFADFAALFPHRFGNVTNGITLRRWLHQANPRLSALIADTLGSNAFLTDARLLAGLERHKRDPAFRRRWARVKLDNKRRLAAHIAHSLGISLDPVALFDIQSKRIHEYKRPQLNLFGLVHRYLALKRLDPRVRARTQPRVSIISGKAAPGYFMAKTIVHLANRIAAVLNADPDTSPQLKLVFFPDYSVSAAELLTPAADVSEHISTAGTEGSGTSNMKFALNGGLLLATSDGATVEIASEIGNDNVFVFGLRAEQTDAARQAHLGPKPPPFPPSLAAVFAAIRSGLFGPSGEFEPLLQSIEGADHFLVSDDFDAYLAAQDRVEAVFCRGLEAEVSQGHTAIADAAGGKGGSKAVVDGVGTDGVDGANAAATAAVAADGTNGASGASGSGQVKAAKSWELRCIESTARMGFFSSDRAVREYADKIWHAKPVKW